MDCEDTVTVESVLERINERLVVLGNKSRSKKQDHAGRTDAGIAARELIKLRNWIELGGRTKKLRSST